MTEKTADTHYSASCNFKEAGIEEVKWKSFCLCMSLNDMKYLFKISIFQILAWNVYNTNVK